MKKVYGVLLVITMVLLSSCTVPGDIGLQGEQGPAGTQGETGADGEQGLQGEQGLTGEQGSQGEVGMTGEQGTNGLSAYELWISIPGNEDKTLEEFFQSLVGSVDSSEVEMLQEQINDLKLMNDAFQFSIWLDSVQDTFVSGDTYPYMYIPVLNFGSVVTGANHTFDYSNMNNQVTFMVSLGDLSLEIVREYTIIMNQQEIDAMNQIYANQDALELQTWLDGLTDEFIDGDSLPVTPLLANGGVVTGAAGFIFHNNPQNGDVILTVTVGGQTATAQRTFTVTPNYQLLVQEDAQFLQQWLNNMSSNVSLGESLPTPPPLPNGSIITSGFPHTFSNLGNELIVIQILNGTEIAQATRWFDVSFI
jgi:hypothetical protein